jgi:hypothetical protein
MVEFLIILAILAVVAYAVTAPLRRAGRARPGDAESSPANGAGARANGSDVAGLEAGGEAGSGAEVAELRSARAEIADLEAAREAKYREIRDAELDRRTGKLSDSDYEATDRTLRAEAIAILNELDRRRGEESGENEPGGEEGRGGSLPFRPDDDAP